MLTDFFVLAFPFIRLANYFLLQPREAFRAYRDLGLPGLYEGIKKSNDKPHCSRNCPVFFYKQKNFLNAGTRKAFFLVYSSLRLDGYFKDII